ncbi:MAG: hypothetical protein ACQCN6_08200, partial [Candidatus Bathyarchaeia archaeon]
FYVENCSACRFSHNQSAIIGDCCTKNWVACTNGWLLLCIEGSLQQQIDKKKPNRFLTDYIGGGVAAEQQSLIIRRTELLVESASTSQQPKPAVEPKKQSPTKP